MEAVTPQGGVCFSGTTYTPAGRGLSHILHTAAAQPADD